MADNNDKQQDSTGLEPKLFALWIAIAAMIMMFAGLTSAYIVKRADTDSWLEFPLPAAFAYSTIILVISSALLHLGYRAFNNGNRMLYTAFLGGTLLLGLAFMGCQYAGWLSMTNSGILLSGNPAGSFIYVISGLHVAHLLGGVIALLVSFIKSLINLNDPIKDLKDIVRPDRKLRVKLLVTYWHFVDVLWVYLFFFFYLNR